MPYEWTPAEDPRPRSAPVAELQLWPYRSLLRRHFVGFIGSTAALIVLPALAVIGSPVLWVLLPFLIAAICGLWIALNWSYKDGEILETLRIWPDHMTLDHQHPRKGHKTWEGNPYWVQVKLRPKGGPVENYLTLKGSDREVELGAFLTEEERAVLHSDLLDVLRGVR